MLVLIIIMLVTSPGFHSNMVTIQILMAYSLTFLLNSRLVYIKLIEEIIIHLPVLIAFIVYARFCFRLVELIVNSTF